MTLVAHRLTVQPLPEVSWHVARETLDRRVWIFRWYANAVDDAWSLDLINDAGEKVAGIPVTGGPPESIDLLHAYRSRDVPPGALIVQSKLDRDPRTNDFREGIATAYYVTEVSP